MYPFELTTEGRFKKKKNNLRLVYLATLGIIFIFLQALDGHQKQSANYLGVNSQNSSN